MARIRAVFFDLDDTLFDYTKSRHFAFLALKERFSDISSASIEDLDNLWTRYWYQLLPAEVIRDHAVIMHIRKERLRMIFSHYGRELSENEIEDVMRTYSESYDSSISQVPGAGDILRKIRERGISVGVITNNPPGGQRKKLKQCRIEDYIDLLVSSGEIGYSKPDPRIFRFSMEKLSATPEESVMIGDSWEYDIVGAINTGIKPVWFNRFGHKKPEKYTDVAEIRSYIPAESILEIIVGPGSA
jgi:putative hydrolase of the HAD superfamily